MTKGEEEKKSRAELRKVAEERVNREYTLSNLPKDHQDLLEMNHELRVHQIELELQNEELTHARNLSEDLSIKYKNLYTLAPMAFLTMSFDGTIQNHNPRFSQLLKKEDQRLEGANFKLFIQESHLKIFDDFLKTVEDSSDSATVDVTVKDSEGDEHYVTIKGVIDGENLNLLITDNTEKVKADEKIAYLARFPSEDPNPVMRVSVDGKIIYANDPARNYLKPLIKDERIHPSWLERIEQVYGLNYGVEREEEMHGRIFRFNLTPIDGENYINIYAENITDKKKTELNLEQKHEELQREKQFTENLISTAKTIILILDPQGRIVRFNPYLEEISGYKLDEVKGKDWFETFIPEEDQDSIREILKNSINEINICGNINPLIAKDGRRIYIEWYDTTIKDSDGKVQGVLSTGQDVTERLILDAKLRASEDKFRVLFEGSSDGILIAELETKKFVLYNPSICKMLGYAPDEIVNLTVSDIHPKESLREVVETFNRHHLHGK